MSELVALQGLSLISVSGVGRASAAPDVMRVHLVASALRPSVAEALAASEQAASAIRAVLASARVAPADASTLGLSIQAEQTWDGGGVPRTTGFRSEHRMAVALRDLAAAGRVLGEALGAGGDDLRLESVGFEVEDDEPLRSRARAVAWADAERRAAQLAELAGVSLGQVHTIGEQSGFMPVPMMAMAAGAEKARDLSVGVEPGAVGVEVSLAVQWAVA
ncbi:MAG: SIMPL domain-containing protein [Kineosporiaceae bacterium]|nr:SIMPL domain-containing protein [Kineosporiaceae bacterium]